MVFEREIREAVTSAFTQCFSSVIQAEDVLLQPTRKDFDGDITLVTFNLAKKAGKGPDAVGQLLGEYLMLHEQRIADFNVVKGFLNLVLKPEAWLMVYEQAMADKSY